MQIISFKDLEDFEKVERICKNENGPVYISKDDTIKFVIMDIEYYEKTIKQIVEAKDIMDGLNDLKQGKVVDGNKAISNIKNKYRI